MTGPKFLTALLFVSMAVIPLSLQAEDTQRKVSDWHNVPGHGQIYFQAGDTYEHSTGLMRDRFGNKRMPTKMDNQGRQYVWDTRARVRRYVQPYQPRPVAPPVYYPPAPQPQPYYQPTPQPYYAPNYPQPYYQPIQPIYPTRDNPLRYDLGPYQWGGCPDCGVKGATNSGTTWSELRGKTGKYDLELMDPPGVDPLALKKGGDLACPSCLNPATGRCDGCTQQQE